MPIVIRILGENGEVVGPVVECDHCYKRIDMKAQGNYQWIPDDLEPHGGKIYFLHKACASQLPAITGARHDNWADLRELPVRLAANLGLDVKQNAENRWEIQTRLV
jgi:hypothetical protein